MGKKRGGRRGGGDKRGAFFRSVKDENLPTLRWSITHGCFNPLATEDDDGHTALQLAAVHGSVRSMEMILDHLKRMRELDQIYDCVDTDDRNVLMMAAARGQYRMVKLLSTYQGLSKDRLWRAKDAGGRTARDYAVGRKHKDIIDFFDGTEVEVEEVDEGPTEHVERGIDLTKVSARKVKNATAAAAEAAAGATKSAVEGPITEPLWPEVKAVLEAEKLPDRTSWLRDLNVTRRKAAADGDEADAEAAALPPPLPGSFVIDPALWRCTTLNVLKLQMPVGAIIALPADVSRLDILSTLIIAGNMIQSLPESIGDLKHLKVLEAGNNALTALPDGLSRCEALEVIDVSHNALTTLMPLAPLKQLVSLHADSNQLTSLDGLTFSELERLVDLSCSGNQISALSPEIGLLAGSLMTLNLSSNKLTAVPAELGQLGKKKKLQKLLLGDNPIKDPRVKKNLKKAEKGGRDLKEALKFLEKSAGKKGKKKGRR